MISLLGSPNDMLRTVFNALTELGLPTTLQCDHICYRVATKARYIELKAALENPDIATLIDEVEIAGRPITTFRLRVPYAFDGHTIDLLELPAPKASSPYPEGWEHAEFVTGMVHDLTARDSLVHFMASYPRHMGFKPHLGKELNPEATIRVNDQYNIKFHPRPLDQVIALEQAEKLAPAA